MYIRERTPAYRHTAGHTGPPQHDSRPKDMQTVSIMRGTRMFRGGLVTDLVLLAVFIILAYVFISRRTRMEGPAGTTRAGGHIAGAADDGGNSQHLIDARVKKIPDFRSAECKSKMYKPIEVSIVSTFFDYSFHDLKATVSSVLMNTPNDLIKEIIIIDDASTLGYIIDKSKTYAKSIAKVKLLRNDKQLWTSGSRTRGFQEAGANIVVFLDTNVIVSQGWLEPLIAQLQKEPSSIAVPHYDSINDPVSYEYKATKDSLAASVSWSLAVRMSPVTLKTTDKTAPFPSPVLRGNALAVPKLPFEQIGGYDEGFQDGAGLDLELSIRAWLCGMKVLVCPCSRVGVVNLQDPVKVTTPVNIRRLTELWFGGRGNLVFRNTAVSKEMSQEEKDSLEKRKSELSNLQCENIDWFFHHIVDHLLTPSEKAIQFGLIKCRTGSCLNVAADKRLELQKCKQDDYTGPITNMVFEFTEDGLLVNDGKCLTVKQTAYILLEDCNHDDNKQRWAHNDLHLINEWSKYCMMHVTDPDKNTEGKRQIVMAQDCNTGPEPQFTNFDFITL